MCSLNNIFSIANVCPVTKYIYLCILKFLIKVVVFQNILRTRALQYSFLVQYYTSLIWFQTELWELQFQQTTELSLGLARKTIGCYTL